MESSVTGPPHRVAAIEDWIRVARNGSAEALGRLLEACRPYLLLVATQELSSDLRSKVGASDLVQDTFLEAQRDFARFRGHTKEELLGWLRRALLHNLANVTRHYRATDKRDVAREISPDDVPPGALPAAPTESPSAQAMARERDEGLARALAQLPEDYRRVVGWRNYERASFEEIGRRLGRSPEAARKVWARAVERLQQILELPEAEAGAL
jgi:RNA polymerase sigma-70 factor (ECF subfamily)